MGPVETRFPFSYGHIRMFHAVRHEEISLSQAVEMIFDLHMGKPDDG